MVVILSGQMFVRRSKASSALPSMCWRIIYRLPHYPPTHPPNSCDNNNNYRLLSFDDNNYQLFLSHFCPKVQCNWASQKNSERNERRSTKIAVPKDNLVFSPNIKIWGSKLDKISPIRTSGILTRQFSHP